MKHLLLLAVSFLIVLSGCNPARGPDAGGGKGKEGSGHVVKTMAELKRTLHRVIEQPGSVAAYEETPLVAHLSGYVDKVNVDIGQLVKGPHLDKATGKTKPGDVLAELRVPELLEELKQKGALVKQAEAEVAQTEAALEAAEAHIQTAHAWVTEAKAARTRA